MAEIKTNNTLKNYEDFLKEKDSPVVYCTLKLDGDDFLNTSHFTLDLAQKAGAHDQFQVTVIDDALDTFEGEIMERSKNLLGKKLNVYLHRFGSIRFTFDGVITQIENKKENGYGHLVITGSAPTILMENGKQCHSFEGQTLSQIVDQVSEKYKGRMIAEPSEVHFNKVNQNLVFPYVVQYNESDFQFLRRLAARYGEWMFYDGVKLVMGAKPYQTIELQENVDLIEATFSLQTQYQKNRFTTYDAEHGDIYAKPKSTTGHQTRANHLQVIAQNASHGLYPSAADSFFNQAEERLSSRMEEMMWRKGEANLNLMVVKGKSRNPDLASGRDVKLRDINDRPMETYRICEVRHFHNGAGEYYNEFTAVPFDTWVPPYFDEDAIPLCEEQSAVVTDNSDPEKRGRIRVQMPWQKRFGGTTPWIRMIQPHAGSGKGFHFIPEVGEEVMLGFENANAEKPFVLGTHYNGKEISGYGTGDNSIKAIHTRSGHIVKFTEDESIIITDKSGNEIHLDTTGSNINITAPETMTLNCKNMNINVGENMTTSVGMNKTNTVGMNQMESIGMNKTETIGMNSSENTGMVKSTTVGADANMMIMGSLMEFIQGNLTSESQNERQETASEVNVSSNSGTINHNAKKQVQNNSGEKGNNF